MPRSIGVRKANLCQTLATCQMFNAEVCYGSGLQYNTDSCGGDVKRVVEDFLLDNAWPSYFLGLCQDFKHFAFCVSVVILNDEGARFVRSIRKSRIDVGPQPRSTYFSIPYYGALFRSEVMSAFTDISVAMSHHTRVIEQLRQIVVTVLQDNQVPIQSLRDIVDLMRKNETSFQHFRNSSTYKLF